MRWRAQFQPLLVNTVVGFIGPEYLYNGKQIIRAGLEDHFCGKLLGLPMGCDICYTNHAEADQDDMDTLLTLLGVGGLQFHHGLPGSDDVMLNYQTTSSTTRSTRAGAWPRHGARNSRRGSCAPASSRAPTTFVRASSCRRFPSGAGAHRVRA